MSKIVVMSDIHFGLEECSIGVPTNGSLVAKKKKNVERLINSFSKEGDIEEVILLGDIFDLNFSNFHNSLKVSEYFFDRLKKIARKITYIPGNHDHAFWLLHVYWDQIIKKLNAASPEEISHDFKFTEYLYTGRDTFLSNVFKNPRNLTVTYPFMRKDINGKRYLFTHGHFIEGTDMIEKIYTKTVGKLLNQILDVEHKNIDQLEIVTSPLHVTANLLGQIERGRCGLRDKNDIVTKFSWGEKHDIDSLQNEIKKFLSYAGQIGANWAHEALHYFIFGHTHSAGINHNTCSFNKNLISINAGCWLERDSGQTIGEFVIIDSSQSQPRLYNFTKEGKEQHLHSKKLDMEIIPERPKRRRFLRFFPT